MTSLPRLRIGSRKSPLALIQAEIVRDALIRLDPDYAGRIEIITLTTSGDKFVDRPLSEIGGKGLFTKELEEGLLAGQIDMAVHSVKDMATTLPDGLMIAAMLEREDPQDMLVGPYKSLDELPQGARFGTSSLRRGAQMKILRPDLEIVPFRGNVQTRLKKLEAGEVAATLLAVAGIKRLGLTLPGFVLSTHQCLPAVAQGAIGIECHKDNIAVQELVNGINHAASHSAVQCERAFLKELDGSCRTPIAGYATLSGDNIQLSGLIAKPDGSAHHAGQLEGTTTDAKALGTELGQQLRTAAGPNFI